MRFLSARKWVILGVLLFCFLLSAVPSFAQNSLQLESSSPEQLTTSAAGNSTAQWVADPEVTEVGKGADRARQLLWWVFSHPGVHTAPVFAELWGISRNIVYILIILVIVAFGFSFILLRRRATAVNIPPLLVKIGGVLLYVTFSYIFIIGLIQSSEIIMRFFIENVGGKDLFNVIFSGAGKAETNYVSFFGYKDANPGSQEMVHTSLFIIRFTSFTYYIISLVLMLRTIILWFLLVLSPFLALLLPFVFIRNIGIIWIGVFFQWLFYGPLVALFLAALTKIWVSGIPYAFDFSRVNQASGQVYRTAINILYGGPAQTLSPGNSANYVDTFAEYVISLVMLWTAIILPWFLLRIFRDYWCEAITRGNTTLSGIFDRIRQYPPPVPPAPNLPSTHTGMAAELPFRQRVEEKIREVNRTHISDIKEISRVNTQEIARSLDISASSLIDVSRFEMNQARRLEVQQKLDNIAAPERIAAPIERERYTALKSELQARAASGDMTAATLLSGTVENKEVLATAVATLMSTRSAVSAPRKSEKLYAPAQTPAQATKISGKPTTPATPHISIEEYEEVKKMWLSHYEKSPVPVSATIKNRQEWITEEEKKLTNISHLLTSSDPKLRQQGLEDVAEILPFMLLGGFSDAEVLAYIKAKLEAAKQMKTQLAGEEKAKEEGVKMEKEEEETLLEVPAAKKEEAKQRTVAEEKKIEV